MTSRLLMMAPLIALAAIEGRAQELDHRLRHRVSAGFGIEYAVAGGSWAYAVPSTPFELGLGAGAVGVSGHARVVIARHVPFILRDPGEAYAGLTWVWGTAAGWSGTHSLAIEVGDRVTLGDRSFLAAGFALVLPLRGTTPLGMMALAFPRFAFGYAF